MLRSQLYWNKQSQGFSVIKHLPCFPEADGLGDSRFCGILWGQICHMKKPCTRLYSLKWDLDGSMAFCRIFPGLKALCSTTNCIWKSVKHHDHAGQYKAFWRNIMLLVATWDSSSPCLLHREAICFSPCTLADIHLLHMQDAPFAETEISSLSRYPLHMQIRHFELQWMGKLLPAGRIPKAH